MGNLPYPRLPSYGFSRLYLRSFTAVIRPHPRKRDRGPLAWGSPNTVYNSRNNSQRILSFPDPWAGEGLGRGRLSKSGQACPLGRMCQYFVLFAHVVSECGQVCHSVAQTAHFKLYVHVALQTSPILIKYKKIQTNAVCLGIIKLPIKA